MSSTYDLFMLQAQVCVSQFITIKEKIKEVLEITYKDYYDANDDDDEYEHLMIVMPMMMMMNMSI